MTQQEKFTLIRKFKHGSLKSHYTWEISNKNDVNMILNCNILISLLKADLSEKPLKIIENLVKSKNYNSQILAIELIYSELLKHNKLPKLTKNEKNS